MLKKSPSIILKVLKKDFKNYLLACRDQDSNLGYHGHNVGS